MPRHQANNYFAIAHEFNTLVDKHALKASRDYVGEFGTLHATRLPPTPDLPSSCKFILQLWYHDEVTRGGILIASSRAVKLAGNYNITSFTLDPDGNLTIVQANGNTVTENISSIDTKVVNFTLQGTSLFITDNKGAVFPVDLSTLDYITDVYLNGNDLVIKYVDGTESFIDLSTVIAGTTDGVVNSFTLNADTNVATITTTLGQSFSANFAHLNEMLIDNQNGTYTFDDGEGQRITITTSWVTALTNPSGNILELQQTNRAPVQIDLSPLLVAPPPATDTNNYVTSHNVADGVLTSQRLGLPAISTNLPLNWAKVSEGSINIADFVTGWPDRPTFGTPLPLGHKDGNNYYINTNANGFIWGGTSGFFRALVTHDGEVAGAAGGGAWGYEVDVIPVTWWWGPARMYIRWTFLDLSGGLSESTTAFNWELWRFLDGLN